MSLGAEAFGDLQGVIPPKLHVLLLTSCELQEAGVRSLLDWLHDSELTGLNLSSNDLSVSAIAPLWSSKGLNRLLQLDLGSKSNWG